MIQQNPVNTDNEGAIELDRVHIKGLSDVLSRLNLEKM